MPPRTSGRAMSRSRRRPAEGAGPARAWRAGTRGNARWRVPADAACPRRRERASLPQVVRARARHVVEGRPVAIPRRVDDGRAIGRRHLLADLADDPQEGALPDRDRPDVVVTVKRCESPHDAEILVAHRDAARFVVGPYLAEIARLQAADGEFQESLTARARRAALDDAEE